LKEKIKTNEETKDKTVDLDKQEESVDEAKVLQEKLIDTFR
jgi:hypothetical protein